MTALLLVTAVWVNMASLETEAAGKARDNISPDEEPPRLAILIEHDQLVLSAFPSGESQTLAAYDGARLETALRGFKTAREQTRVEVAAASTNAHPIAYQHLIAAMDAATKVGYPRVTVTDATLLRR